MAKVVRDVQSSYSRMFDTAEGRQILEDLKQQFYHYGTTFVPGDPYATARNEGQRLALLYIMAQLEKES